MAEAKQEQYRKRLTFIYLHLLNVYSMGGTHLLFHPSSRIFFCNRLPRSTLTVYDPPPLQFIWSALPLRDGRSLHCQVHVVRPSRLVLQSPIHGPCWKPCEARAQWLLAAIFHPELGGVRNAKWPGLYIQLQPDIPAPTMQDTVGLYDAKNQVELFQG